MDKKAISLGVAIMGTCSTSRLVDLMQAEKLRVYDSIPFVPVPVDLEYYPGISLETYGTPEILCTRQEYVEIGKEDRERMDKVIKAMSASSKKLMEGVAYKALTGRISPDDCAHSWEHTCISSGHLIECTLCGYEEWYDIKGKRML